MKTSPGLGHFENTSLTRSNNHDPNSNPEPEEGPLFQSNILGPFGQSAISKSKNAGNKGRESRSIFTDKPIYLVDIPIKQNYFNFQDSRI